VGSKVRERIARIRRALRDSFTRESARGYNREPAGYQAGGRTTVTDDYDFRASERRRARELDELEARRRRGRERQRAQLRAAHRRRRLTVLGILGLVIGVASGAWVWRSDTPKVRQPTVPVKAVTVAKKAGRTMPVSARGPHISEAWSAKPGFLDSVLAKPGVNLIQLDVKDENGEVAGLEGRAPATAARIGAVREYYDLAHVTRLAHDRHIWVVARIVGFKDPIAARAIPSIAIRDVHGGIWKDGGGVPWLNQYSPGAWNYLIGLAKAAAATGVDEVQFDYMRFPSEGNLGDMRFPGKVKEPMDATIPRFLAAARKALAPYDVKLGIDVFGLAADHNLGIGQNVARIGKHVDVISPMLYPNHYGPGELGIIDPNADPSSTVALSMGTFRQQLIDSPKVKIRPWLQDFGGYGLAQIRAQTNAADRQGSAGWMLWDAAMDYTWAAFGTSSAA
jgi:hypothetical protein